MRNATEPGHVGSLLREWRRRRRMSQLDLALDAEVSARHLSFVETGRSRPSAEMVVHLAERLEIPLRDRNHLLLAAGFAPAYEQRDLDDPAMAPVREAIDRVLAAHAPFPAVVVDRQWEVVARNEPAALLLTSGVADHLLAPPINALRLTLHPEGLAPRIVNLPEWRAHLLDRLGRQTVASGDPALAALHEELAAYPRGAPGPTIDLAAGEIAVPLRIRHRDRELAFLSTLATFGTAVDITLSELSIESFFPADAATAKFTHELLAARP